MSKTSRWLSAIVPLGILVGLLAACSFIFDSDDTQCTVREDCVAKGFTGTPTCEQGVCVASNLGPEGCFYGTPTTPEQFANRCTAAECEPFDNCARLGQCDPNEAPPALVPPPDAGPSSTADASFPAQPCVEDPATTIVVTGSSAVSGFLQTVAPLVAASGFRIAYQPSGSCNGVDQIFNADPNKRIAKDRAGTTSLLFPTDGTKGINCTWGTGAVVDVGVSDVFSTSCNVAYMPSATVADFLGPVQPMTFVVPASSDQTAISAEMGRIVFGRGGSVDPRAMPWTDPSLYFVRNASSGTQQMIARAIGVDAGAWWGKNAGGTSGVVNGLQNVVPSRASSVIGILSTDALKTEEVRRNIRVLAFQDKGQICGFYPDRIKVSLDKQNVRDGHYPIWGPVHFFTAISNGQPTTKAGALVQRFSLPGIDQVLLDALISGGLVPQCAMKVARDTEMGPIKAYDPPFHCGCYFESKLADNSVPPGCTRCTSTNNCPAEAPACNLGFCEAR